MNADSLPGDYAVVIFPVVILMPAALSYELSRTDMYDQAYLTDVAMSLAIGLAYGVGSWFGTMRSRFDGAFTVLSGTRRNAIRL